MAITRHGNYGGPRGLYGDFTGKELAAVQVLHAIHAKAGIYRAHATSGAYRPHTKAGTYRPQHTGGRTS